MLCLASKPAQTDPKLDGRCGNLGLWADLLRCVDDIGQCVWHGFSHHTREDRHDDHQ